MEWDLGIEGVGVLAGMSLVFGLIAHVLTAKTTTRWMWLIAAIVYFAAGIFVSEMWFGWATEEDLQPNIDGLSRDEVLLLGTLIAAAVVVAVRHLVGRARHRSSTSPVTPPRARPI